MENALIIQHLQRFLAEQAAKPPDKRTAHLYAKLRSVAEDEISLGNPPSYCFACLRCNSTGVGKSSFEGTETQRTVARDYVTDIRYVRFLRYSHGIARCLSLLQ